MTEQQKDLVRDSLKDEVQGFWARQTDKTIKIVSALHLFIFIALQLVEGIPVFGDAFDMVTLYVGHELVQLFFFIPVEMERRRRKKQMKKPE